MSPLAKILSLPPRRNTNARPSPADDDESTRRALSRRDRRARWRVGALVLVALALYWIGVVMGNRQDLAGIRELPPSARAALLDRSMNELETVCTAPAASSGMLRDHCVEEAHFLLQLAECTERCRRATAVILPHAHR